MKLIGSYKKVLIVSGIAVVSAAMGAIAVHPSITHGDFDLTGLNQQVQNHEARLTNTENDVKDLQANTNTAPAADPVAVPVVTAKQADPAPAPVAQTAPTTAPTPETIAPVVLRTTPYCTNNQFPSPTHLWRWES